MLGYFPKVRIVIQAIKVGESPNQLVLIVHERNSANIRHIRSPATSSITLGTAYTFHTLVQNYWLVSVWYDNIQLGCVQMTYPQERKVISLLYHAKRNVSC